MGDFKFVILTPNDKRVLGIISAQHADAAFKILEEEMIPMFDDYEIMWIEEHEYLWSE